jgi:hypothetical protein
MALALLAGCSRERLDWKSAESADTLEAYDHFVVLHPDSALATQARARMTQLVEDRDWQRASSADTAESYKQFLAQHANGKWAEEARIRAENFALDGNPSPNSPVVVSDSAPAANMAGASPQPDAPVPSVPAHSTPAPAAAAGKPAPIKPPAPAAAASAPNGSSKHTSPDPTVAAAPAKAPGKLTPAAAASPAATAVASGDSGFGIQLGAFGTQAAALGAWKNLQVRFDPQLHGLFAHAVPVHATAGQLFRLQSPVGDEARARGICAALVQQSQPCVVVLPQSH